MKISELAGRVQKGKDLLPDSSQVQMLDSYLSNEKQARFYCHECIDMNAFNSLESRMIYANAVYYLYLVDRASYRYHIKHAFNSLENHF